jgi:hypothetical protein
MLDRTKTPLKKRVPTAQLKRTTIRDFGGGLNVIDTELNLTSRYSPIFDNTVRFADGSVAPRFGFAMELKLHQGTVSSGTTPVGTTVTTALNSKILLINWTAHPFAVGGHEHITLSGIAAPINGIPITDLNRTHGVRYVTANQIAIVVSTKATSASSPAFAGVAYIRDNHALGGNIVDGFSFSSFLFIVSDIGEIVSVSSTWVVARLWDYTISNALGGAPLPWGPTEIITYDYWAGTTIVDNGVDKPLIIDPTKSVIIDYLVDPGNSSSNVKIPAFDLCKSAFRYFAVHATEDVDGSTDVRTLLRITSKNTSMVFAGAPSPGDAVDVDIARIAANMDPTITGLAVIKDTLMVIMPTITVLLRLGTYVTPTGSTTPVHEPTPTDIMPNFGTSAPRSVVEVGNDVFMLDYSGVPSAKLSQQQNTIVPERVSQLVDPMFAAHIGRLTKDTLRKHAFGTFDSKNRCVHIYVPKFDVADIRTLALNPFVVNATFVGTQQIIMFVRDHGLEIGDKLDITGAVSFNGVDAAWLNGRRTVVGILNDDTIVIEIGGTVPVIEAQSGGGASVVIQPVNDETIGYIYHYVPALKINSWSRFKGMKLNGGCQSVEGRTFFFTDDKILRYGSIDEPVYGDFFNDYDKTWAQSTAYSVNDRVRDSVSSSVFVCRVAHTSPGTGTFADARETNSENWSDYEGVPITMSWELPWSDFGMRQDLKAMKHISFDAQGSAQFTVSAFVDNIYRTSDTGALQPARQIVFTGGDSAGFGGGDQPYGAGRRTREQFLWNFPLRSKLLKLRIDTSTTRQLRISAISFTYHKGGLVRS